MNTDVANLTGRFCVQPKINGEKVIAFLPADHGKVLLLGASVPTTLVEAKLQEINQVRTPAVGIYLEGVLTASKDGSFDPALPEKGQRLFVFDMMTERERANPVKPYARRYEEAKTFVQNCLFDVPGSVFRLGFVESYITIDPRLASMKERYMAYMLAGYGGAIYRSADQTDYAVPPIDLKPFTEREVEVISAHTGSGRHNGVLGSLLCAEANTTFAVTSGFNEEQRKIFMKMAKQNTLPKKAILRYADGYSPVFKQFQE